MIVTADDVTRSLRGTAALLNRRPDGLRSFDFSEAGFWHSFGAIVLTLPAFVVTLALERRRLGLALPGRSLVDDNGLLALVALAIRTTIVARSMRERPERARPSSRARATRCGSGSYSCCPRASSSPTCAAPASSASSPPASDPWGLRSRHASFSSPEQNRAVCRRIFVAMATELRDMARLCA